MGSSALPGEGTTRLFITSADGAGGIDRIVSVFITWKKGRVQKRTTKILSLVFLFKIERHLIEVSHKCFFPGRKYRRIKVSPREKAWGNQGV